MGHEGKTPPQPALGLSLSGHIESWQFTIDPAWRAGQALGMFATYAVLLAVVIYRVALGMADSSDWSWIHNFSPIGAIALCGAVYLPRRTAWVLPIAMLLASDAALNLFRYHAPIFTLEIIPRYLALALITALGLRLRKSASGGASGSAVMQLLAAGLVSSLIFYFVSNTASWISEPAYAKSLAGWVQAMTVGLPGFPSTIYFYRQTFLSDLLFTALFVGCMAKNAAPMKAGNAGQLAQG